MCWKYLEVLELELIFGLTKSFLSKILILLCVICGEKLFHSLFESDVTHHHRRIKNPANGYLSLVIGVFVNNPPCMIIAIGRILDNMRHLSTIPPEFSYGGAIPLFLHNLQHVGIEDMHSAQLCSIIANKYFDVWNHGKFYTESVIWELFFYYLRYRTSHESHKRSLLLG